MGAQPEPLEPAADGGAEAPCTSSVADAAVPLPHGSVSSLALARVKEGFVSVTGEATSVTGVGAHAGGLVGLEEGPAALLLSLPHAGGSTPAVLGDFGPVRGSMKEEEAN